MATLNIFLLPDYAVYVTVVCIVILLMVLIIIILCLLWKIRVLKARLLSKTCQELISLTVKAEAVSESFAETRLYEEICERNDVVLKTNEAYACAYTVETAVDQ